MKPTIFKIIAGFVLLFLCYHTAEYLMLFRNSPLGFLAVSALFFPLAFFISRWQGDKNLQGWGIRIGKGFPVFFLTGLLSGLVVSSLLLITCLAFKIEAISFVPPLSDFLSQAAVLVFGCSLSSLTEDVLTRSYLFRHANGRLSQPALVLLSALLYALNHIHRLDQPVYFLYVFVLGVQFMIPFVITKNVWYTFGVHWAGNIVYHLANNVMHTTDGGHHLSAMAVTIVFAVMAVPLHFFISRQLVSGQTKTTFFQAKRHSSALIRHSSSLV